MTVTKQMSIGEVLSIDRSTAHIFMEFGMHCLGCPHATAESIADACAAHEGTAGSIDDLTNEIMKIFPRATRGIFHGFFFCVKFGGGG